MFFHRRHGRRALPAFYARLLGDSTAPPAKSTPQGLDCSPTFQRRVPEQAVSPAPTHPLPAAPWPGWDSGPSTAPPPQVREELAHRIRNWGDQKRRVKACGGSHTGRCPGRGREVLHDDKCQQQPCKLSLGLLLIPNLLPLVLQGLQTQSPA